MKIVYDPEVERKNFKAGLELKTPFDEQRYRDVEIMLFEKNGEPVGRKNEEGLFVVEKLYFYELNFTKSGVYEFTARNLMSKYKTNGIHKVDVILKRN